jgi:protein arginine kinase activator
MDKPICPLTGKVCSLPKYLTITDIENGNAKSVKICSMCAGDYLKKESDEKEKSTEDKAAHAQSVYNFLQDLLELKPKTEMEDKKGPCPGCQATINDIAEDKKLGCPQCYSWFGNEIKGVLRTTQAGLKHVGKVPEKFKAKMRKEKSKALLFDLEGDLRVAIQKEDYESAAELRDMIETIKENQKKYK